MNAVSELISNHRKLVREVACLAAEGRLFQRTAPLFSVLYQRLVQGWLHFYSFKPRPNDRNMPTQHIATLLGATCCVRLATMLPCVATCWVLLVQIWSQGQTIATSQRNITQHCWPSICTLWPNDCNIWTQQIATLLSAICCTRLATLLRRVATCCELKIKLVRM